MADKKKFTLYYAGTEFDLGDDDHGILDEYDGTAGTIKVNLDNGKWLTLAVGPGIPIAIAEAEVKPAAVSRAAFGF